MQNATGGIPEPTQELNLPAIVQCLWSARTTRLSLQKDHRTLRQNYLEYLAQALVLKRAPYLADDSKYDEKLTQRTEKEVRRLIRVERKRYLYRLIKTTLTGVQTNLGGLSRVDVPFIPSTHPAN
jgi:hypothetical protein